MRKISDTGEVLIGNDSYEGYCKDLADLIAKKLGISCKFVMANGLIVVESFKNDAIKYL